MVQLFIEGGIYMVFILIVLIIGLAIVGERLYHLIKGLASNYEFAESISKTLDSSGFDAAEKECQDAVGPVANLCLISLDSGRYGVENAEKSLEQSGSVEMASLEKNMTWISLCIATAPMLGFLGTVVGMIQAFNDIKMANDISPAVVAGGISIALLTTAFGLVAAIFLQFFQNLVLYIIDHQIVTMQKSMNLLLESIKKQHRNK